MTAVVVFDLQWHLGLSPYDAAKWLNGNLSYQDLSITEETENGVRRFQYIMIKFFHCFG
jgi:hypothetical protein